MKKNNPSIHIGFYCETFLMDWSGVERIFADLARAMLQRGHRCTIIAHKPLLKVSKKIPVTPIPTGCGLLQLDLSSPAGLTQAKATLAASGLDVVVAPFCGSNFLPVPLLLQGTGIPLVAAECIHPEVLTYERLNPKDRYQALESCNCIQVLLACYLPFYPPALQDRIMVVGNPAPLPKEVDHTARRNKSKRTLLAVGRMDEEHKQYSLLLRAWQLLAPQFPNWSLTMVGDGKDFLLYQEMVKLLGKDARITLTGSVLDTSPYYHAADLFCMPSSRQEGMPLVLGEAASYGLPIVALTACDAANYLLSDAMGALVPEATPLALAQSLSQLMSAPATLRQHKGQNAQAFFHTHYHFDKICDQWEHLFLVTSSHHTIS